ncbi:MAG: cobalt-precorrin-5B (C(1))-methyltransferase, partial [Geminicoccaceae bacterium]
IDEARGSKAASRVLQLAREARLPLADDVADRARSFVLEQLDDKIAIEVMVFDRAGELVGRATGW